MVHQRHRVGLSENDAVRGQGRLGGFPGCMQILVRQSGDLGDPFADERAVWVTRQRLPDGVGDVRRSFFGEADDLAGTTVVHRGSKIGAELRQDLSRANRSQPEMTCCKGKKQAPEARFQVPGSLKAPHTCVQ